MTGCIRRGLSFCSPRPGYGFTGVPQPQICSGWKLPRKVSVEHSITGKSRVYAEENGGPGELLAEIHTVWFMADPVERKILRPEKFTHPLPTIPPEEAMEPFGAAGSV